MRWSTVLGTGLFGLCYAANDSDPLTVTTNTGSYTGLVNSEFASVKEFRNIPYAQAPVGERRWLPPAALSPSDEHHYSYRYPPSCPQFVSSAASFWNLFVPYYLINNGQQNHTSGLVAEESAEDCLSLAVWAPYNATSESKLPVVLYITGGGFQTGGVAIPGQYPHRWVARTGAHIVITINYRVNIFGFPNAAGLTSQNLGILDQRIALEWVQQNIASFGGDPEQIIMWGQSAGAISTDWHNFAYWNNSIVKGSYSQSGNALTTISSSDTQHTNFTFVAKSLGCDFPSDAAAELDCMRQVPMQEIMNFVGQYSGSPSIAFSPVADEEIVFSDYAARIEAGLVAPHPVIMSGAANEMSTLYTWPADNATAGPWQPTITALDLGTWVCPTLNMSRLRHAAGLTTFRSQYAGNWTNQTPYSWLGAYHSSDLAMNFGTYTLNRTGSPEGASELERQTSEAMQDYFFAFVKDPENGPQALGWLPYEYGSNMVRFASQGIVAQNVSGYEIDGPCDGNGTYNPFP